MERIDKDAITIIDVISGAIFLLFVVAAVYFFMAQMGDLPPSVRDVAGMVMK